MTVGKREVQIGDRVMVLQIVLNGIMATEEWRPATVCVAPTEYCWNIGVAFSDGTRAMVESKNWK